MPFEIFFVPSGRGKVQHPADPNFPDGVRSDGRAGPGPSCTIEFPYPAPECGYFIAVCLSCGFRVAVTAAGRVDDPRSLMVSCGLPRTIPDELTCDVCAAIPAGLWFYPTREWSVPMLGRVLVFAAGSFGVCDSCCALVERADIGGLVDAAEKGNGERGAGFRAVLADTYQKFRAARLGPPEYRTKRIPEEAARADS